MSENESSAHVLDVKAFKDTTNILQGLFKSNKVNHVTNVTFANNLKPKPKRLISFILRTGQRDRKKV